MAMEKLKQKRWLKLALYLAILIGLSFGLVLLFRYLMAYFNVSVERFAPTVYLIVFVTALVGNASIIVPVPIFAAIIVTAAAKWDPVIVALIASTAGTLGELTGYYAGYLGKKIIVTETAPGYEKLVAWMKRYGTRAIFLLSLQPILPFDIAGLISGASRVSLWRFLLACWAGKFPKYLVGCYLGPVLWNLLPLPPL